MKKKLLIVVGAGASIDFGMPSVGKIDELFSNWANQGFTLQDKLNSNLYWYLRDTINTYYKSKTNNKFIKQTNFEEVLYQSILLDGILFDPQYENAFNSLITIKPLPNIKTSDEFRELFKEKLIKNNDLNLLTHHLIDRLVDFFNV